SPTATDSYCAQLYPHFIANAFLPLTLLQHPLFSELRSDERDKLVTIFQDCSGEFFQFFAKILKTSPGKLAFEEYLCESSPNTPTLVSPTHGSTTVSSSSSSSATPNKTG